MSEHNDDWLTSIDRAVEVTEGQLELARALKIDSISVQVDRARVLVDAICNLRRRVGQFESERR